MKCLMKTKKLSFVATILCLCTMLLAVGCSEEENSAYQKTLTIASKRPQFAEPTPAYWVKMNDNKNWQVLYDPIYNLNYEEGYEYKVVVSITPFEKTGPDMPTFKYTVIQLLSKEKKNSDVPITTKDLSSIPN